jgi:hypothetical protein
VAPGGAHRCCSAQEFTTGGAKGGGHYGDPYWLHGWAIEGWRWAGSEEDKWAVVVLDDKLWSEKK